MGRAILKSKKNTETTLPDKPPCDICIQIHGKESKEVKLANFDGRTHSGIWAFMCDEHFNKFGKGLGLGRGQKIIIKEIVSTLIFMISLYGFTWITFTL